MKPFFDAWPWLSGKPRVICEAQGLGSGDHQCFCDHHSANIYGTPTGCQVVLHIPTYLLYLFLPPTARWGFSSIPQRGGPQPMEPSLPQGQEQSPLARIHGSHPQGKTLAPGSHPGQFRREQTQQVCSAHPTNQKGKIKKQTNARQQQTVFETM